MNKQTILLAGSVALLVLFALLWLLPENGNPIVWAMQTLPLLCTLPGQRRGDRRTLQWLGFLLLFYLVNGILQTFNPSASLRMPGIILTLVSCGMFVLVLLALKAPSPR